MILNHTRGNQLTRPLAGLVLCLLDAQCLNNLGGCTEALPVLPYPRRIA